MWQRYRVCITISLLGYFDYHLIAKNNIQANFYAIFFQYFNTISYKIGGYNYSLNDIENGLLRGNQKAVAAFRKPFSKDDPRLQISLKEPDSRVHFALVCGARSCPPVKTYSSEVILIDLT